MNILKPFHLSILILIVSFSVNANLTTVSLDRGNDPSQSDIDEIDTSDVACLLGDEMCPAANNLSAQAAKVASDAHAPPPTKLFDTPQMFYALKNAYPGGDSGDVKKLIGREDEDWITNTCVIRLSYALNNSKIPDFRVNPDKSRSRLHIITDQAQPSRGPYAFRVDEFVKYMVSRYGRPSFAKSLNDPDIARSRMPTYSLRNAFNGKKGIILFVVDFSDATGHFDVWDGAKASHEDYFSRATHVFLWQ
jgi:hypothetical protein